MSKILRLFKKPHLISKTTLNISTITRTRLKYTSAASVATISVYKAKNEIPKDWYIGGINGMLLGISASIFGLTTGRIAGMSGLIGSVLDRAIYMTTKPFQNTTASQFSFVSGLLISGLFWNQYYPKYFHDTISTPFGNISTYAPNNKIPYSPLIMLTGGLLVGIGARMGMGCTSGHGICGIGRQSIRSISATVTFLSVAIATTTLTDIYLPELYKNYDNSNDDNSKLLTKIILPTIACGILLSGIITGKKRIGNENISVVLPSMLCGFGFATGLHYSGMGNPLKIRNFLNMNPKNFENHFDPTLMFVFCGGLSMSVPFFWLLMRRMKYGKLPIFTKQWNFPGYGAVDKRLIVGSSLFGMGWGLSGICPGPSLVLITNEEHSKIGWYFVAGMLVGMKLYSPLLRLL